MSGMGSMPDIRNTGGTYFLGRYRVVDEIGIGGMASVHLARMDGPGGFQKWVAIKKIHPHLVEDESFVQMFLDEARVAARISHPNVATVFDLGKHEDTYWIAMEYLHGEPLREVMRRTEELGTAMPPEIACRVIADAAEGLHAAHELLGKNGEKLGLVHRDVTPHNLFVTYDGVTKVVDFGIAKFSSRMSHTRAGTLKGKLAYMSPEQVHGEGIDRRTDIFALGVVLWELTTGQRLFRMESDLDTLAKVQECNVPRPSTLIRGYPVDLEKIVMKALAKNRGERFRTARELSRALQSLLMRRGLFIASDEVAAYTQSIFTDRIQKREAHLRWAAEVTQTINVDQLLSKPKIGGEFTNSEVQSSGPTGGSKHPPVAAPGPVRPAAGMPPPTEPATPRSHGHQPPLDLKSTGPSATAPRAPIPAPRPAAGRPPTHHNLQPVRSAAPPPPSVQPPPSVDTDEHPADGDGPTIQAPTSFDEAFMPPDLRGASPAGLGRPGARTSDPPTVMEPAAMVQEGATIMASPNARDAMMAAAVSSGALPIEPEDLEEDQDATIVGTARDERSALQAPPTFPASMRPQPRPAAPQQRFAATAQMPPQMNPISGMGGGMGGGPSGGYAPAHTGEVAFADAGGPSVPPLHGPHGDVGDFGRGMGSFGPSAGLGPEFGSARSAPGRMQPTMPRMGPALTHDNRTMTAQRFKRRPPMWVVAALSCSIALLIAGVVLAIVSSSGGPAPVRATPSGATASMTPSGPFGTARHGFNNAATSSPASGSSVTPTAAPPVVTAAAPTDTAAPSSAGVATAAATTASPAATTAPPAPAPAPSPVTTAAANTATARPVPVPVPVPAPAPTPVATAKKSSAPAALGALTVVCMPKCDQIVDNGSPLGPGHIFNRPVPAGRHVLTLSAPNGAKKNLQVEVVPGETREVRISMDK